MKYVSQEKQTFNKYSPLIWSRLFHFVPKIQNQTTVSVRLSKSYPLKPTLFFFSSRIERDLISNYYIQRFFCFFIEVLYILSLTFWFYLNGTSFFFSSRQERHLNMITSQNEIFSSDLKQIVLFCTANTKPNKQFLSDYVSNMLAE